MVLTLSYCSCPNASILISLILFALFLSTHQLCIKTDHDSLLHVSHYFTSSSPLNWTPGTNCCAWEGIVCDPKGQVTRLWLPSRGLTGSISPSLGNLTHLSHLNLSHNCLTGPLPSVLLSSLNPLQSLDLSFNALGGEFPSSSSPSLSLNNSSVSLRTVDLSSNRFQGTIQSSFLQSAVSLVYLNVSNNGFWGPLPSSVCTNYRLLRVLDFSFNDFSGQVPLGFGDCSKLEVFNAGFNHLTGHLPYDIYTALALREISLPSNKLKGQISNGIVRLSNLTVLELHTNNLTGMIPRDIGKLSNLERLILHMNGFTGTLPPSLFNCTNLQKLSLLSNSFQGDISDLEFSKLHKLNALDLGSNNFTGEFPKSLYSCRSLKAIRLGQNKLEGQITQDMLELQSLIFLSLSFNRFTNISGAIKILMGLENLTVLMISGNFLNEAMPEINDSVGFRNLQFFSMGRCQLVGQVPTWLKKLRQLRVLDLAANQLKGSIPSWLGTLPDLFYINFHSNLLSGGFPQTLTELSALMHNASEPDPTYLELPLILQPQSPKLGDVPARIYNQISNLQPMIDVHNNSLNGTIPAKIGQLKRLVSLDLSRNEFYGKISDHISELSNLEMLDLSHNHLSGGIPHSLGGLNFLSAFNVSLNNLWGPIPQGTQMQSFDASAYVGNAGLCGPPLPNHCNRKPENEGKGDIQEEEKDDKRGNLSLYVSMGLGFIVGFWGICGTLWLNSAWRSAYFQFLIAIKDQLYVTVALCMTRSQRKL